MKNRKKLVTLLMITALLAGCGQEADAVGESADTLADSIEAGESQGEEMQIPGLTDEEMFSDRDFTTDDEEGKSAVITLTGDSAECSSDAVGISGSAVTITDEGTYVLSGELTDGSIIVDAENTDKLQLVLDGAVIHSETSAAIYIRQADKVVITTAEGSENYLSNGGEFAAIDDNNIDAAIFSKDDLTLNGQGSLTVESPAGHGVVSKDDLAVTGGSYVISSAGQGLNGKESVRIADGVFTISSGKDGIHAENTDDASLGFVYLSGGSYEIEAQGDGISASAYLYIGDGEFTITAGGGSVNGASAGSSSYGQFPGGGRGGRGGQQQAQALETDESSSSMKGLKAAGGLYLNGGSFVIDSADDGVHSDTSIAMTDGSFDLASGDDAFHAEETLTVSGGGITVSASYEGLEALDLVISGGVMEIVSSDDGLNAAGGTDASGMGGRDNGGFGGGGGMFSAGSGSILITGGELSIQASGDGIDANGTLEITGGYITVCGPTTGDTATLDYDASAVITGGTFIGTGASMMAQTFSDSSQGVISVSVGTQPAGTSVSVEDAEGNVLLSHEPQLSFGVVIISSPDLKQGETYRLTVGGLSEEFQAD